MAYMALYRKLRPKNFSDVIGQEHIVKTLVNQIKSRRISHAYLFCGTRGTGKTSTAKIFAKAINCLNPCEGQPCNECEICVDINESNSMNIIEIDAASNNGVENIRDIREEVKYVPAKGNYKVYIIDEVHMLSIGAFNALLKTLEEPPSHIVFILATTDPQKIPATIHSRCQRFDFKRISNIDISNTLKKYVQGENIDIEDSALNYIADISDGAMRDALSILDQCIAFYFDEKITLDKVMEISGSAGKEVFFEMTDSIFNRDCNKCLEIIEFIVINGRDIGQFVSELILHFRNIVVACTVDINSKVMDFSQENVLMLKSQGEKYNKNKIIETINIFSELQNQLKYSSNDRTLLEILCIKLCTQQIYDIDEIKERIDNLEKLLKNKLSNTNLINNANNLKEDNSKYELRKETIQKAIPDDYKNVINNWNSFAQSLKPLLCACIKHITPCYINDRFLYIVCSNIGQIDLLNDKKEEITNGLEKMFSKVFEIKIISDKEYNIKHKEVFGVEDESTKKENKEFTDIKEKIMGIDIIE